MRLDKFLSHTGYGSRKEVKILLKKKVVKVNNTTAVDSKTQVDMQDVVTVYDDIVHYQEFYYYVLNKPQGVISATEDNFQETILDLFKETDYREDLAPVGRLDKDTEGLILVTNDGQLNHHLLSPRHHVEKEYYAEVSGIITIKEQDIFQKGIILTSGELCKPASLTIHEVDYKNQISKINLVITEGKFHQVKRMFKALDKHVLYLKRLRMGSLRLDEDLALGQYRALTEEEVNNLKE